MIDSELVQPLAIDADAGREVIPIARRLGRPIHLGQSAESRENHVLNVLEVGHVFGPDVGLRAEDVVLIDRRKIRRHWLERINLLQWEIASYGVRLLGLIQRLVMVEGTMVQREAPTVVARGGRL